jgi:MraZ protein
MFLGEHSHSLDAKGRVILPARFREALASAYITRQLDGCLAVWTPQQFDVRAAEIQAQAVDEPSRNRARVFFSGAEQANPDRQGRIAIPPSLRQFAQLERDVVVAGVGDHVEIWDASVWQEKKQAGEEALRG